MWKTQNLYAAIFAPNRLSFELKMRTWNYESGDPVSGRWPFRITKNAVFPLIAPIMVYVLRLGARAVGYQTTNFGGGGLLKWEGAINLQKPSYQTFCFT